MKTKSLLLLFCLSLAAPVAHAASSEIRRYLDASRALFDDLEYERALEQLERAKKLSATVSESVELNLLEGVLLAELQRPGPAAAAFRAALVLEPKAQLSVQVSPQVKLQLEAVRNDVLAKKRANEAAPEVVAKTEPTPPEVRADGENPVPVTSGGTDRGLTLGLRGDFDVLNKSATGGLAVSPGLSFAFAPGMFGVAAVVFPKQDPGFRLEGRLYPLEGMFRPFVGVGASAFTTSVGPRAALGFEARLGRVALFVDGAFEKHFGLGGGSSPTVALVGAGAGLAF